MPSSQIKTCPIKSAHCAWLVTLTRTHLDGRSSEACWFDVALLCADSRRTQRKYWVHIVHTEETWYSCSQQRTGTTATHRTPWTLANSLTAHTNKHNTHLFFLVLLGCFCVECSNQICKAYRTYPNDNQPLTVHRKHFFLLMTEVMSLQKVFIKINILYIRVIDE